MNKRPSGSLSLSLLIPLLTFIVGCDSGSTSGGAVSTGSQAPDPVVQDFPVFFVQRPFVFNAEGATVSASQRSLTPFETGANLKMKVRALPSAESVNLTTSMLRDEDIGLYDIRDLNPDYSGEKLLFSMRGPFDSAANEDEQPSWNIWQYDLSTNTASRLITSDTLAEAGHDREPQYLPNGKIVFTSNRQRTSKAILLDEGRPQFSALEEDRNNEAFVLHVMNDDGSDIKQITFNQSHDRDPAVTLDGKLVFKSLG